MIIGIRIILTIRSNSPSNYVVRSSDGSNIFTDLKISHVEQVTIVIIVNIVIIIIIIITITRSRPAFGRLGLGRLSGGKTLGDVSTPRFAPSALSSTLKQYILALLSQSSSSLLYAKV